MAKYDNVFKAYDIRGVFPKEIDAKFAEKLGRAFAVYTSAKTVGVGYDGRSSSKKLFDKLVKGLTGQGSDVIEFGQISTPECYFSMFQGKYDAGIMITASHDPKNYNGFKLLGKMAVAIRGNSFIELKELIDENNWEKPKKKGKIKKKSWSKDYEKFLKGFFPAKSRIKRDLKNFNVVVDQSNGTGIVETKVLSDFFPKCKVINARVAGTFPGHEPNPMEKKNRKQLVYEVKKNKADIGLIFDGDADRVCFVDEKGGFVRPDIITALLIEDYRKGSIIYDTRSSKFIPEKAKKLGFRPILSKAGRTHVMDLMKKENAELGGEASGHYFFKQFKGHDCAGVAAIKILSRLITSKPEDELEFSDIVSDNNPYFHTGELNFKIKNQNKALLIIEQAFTNPKKSLFIDGISFYYDDYWFNIRKSNTEPLIRVNAEADSEENIKWLEKKLNKIMVLAK